MDAQAVAGLVGVVLGAALGTGGTWLVSSALERRREKKRLCGVIGLLAAELEDNRERIARGSPEWRAQEDWSRKLTYGDWHANKATFSELLRNESLWERVVKAYGGIYAASHSGRKPPDPETLGEVARQLRAEREELLRQIQPPKWFALKRS